MAWHSRAALLVWQVTFGTGWPSSSPEAGEASLALPAQSPTLFPGTGRKLQGCPGAELPGGPKRGRPKQDGGPRQLPSPLLARHKSRRSTREEDLASTKKSPRVLGAGRRPSRDARAPSSGSEGLQRSMSRSKSVHQQAGKELSFPHSQTAKPRSLCASFLQLRLRLGLL